MKSELTTIVTRQKREWDEKRQRNYVPRVRFDGAQKLLPSSLIKVITGPRRAGKSVLAALLLKDQRSAYFNFDEISTSHIDTEELVTIIGEVYGSFDYIFFDEIQNLDGWQLFLNRLQREGHNLVVSGSNANLLSGELATHLTGRYAKIEVFPFCFSEFLAAKDSKGGDGNVTEAAHQFLTLGGYPEIVLSKDFDSKDYLRTLVSAVVSKDIVTRHRLRKSSELSSVADWVFSNVAKEISFSRLVADGEGFGLPFSVQTVKKYLGFFEEAYLTKMVSRYDHSHRERIKSPKKIYAIDNGAALAVGFRATPDNGRLLENLVYGELRKTGAFEEIRYYKTSQGDKEVDFVLRQGHQTVELVQSAWEIVDAKTRKRELVGLVAAAKETHCEKATIVTWLQETEVKIGPLTVRVVPFYKWARDLQT